ncbi:MAG: transporter substrate-binding domain-containing protein [Candidatus Aminicenantes bacterium]|nr:transporter substrate-binding domain-containing protein [Candidatus Aminicenantes bacterium]
MGSKRNIIKKIPSLVLLLVVVLVFFTISANSQPETKADKAVSKLDQIKKAGKLVVGTSPDYPPYEFHLLNDRQGEIVGLDVDIAKEIARELGVKLELKNIIFHKLFEVLNQDQVDMVIAGLAPSVGRRQLVDFSDVYYQAIQNMLIRSLDSEIITSLIDLRGKKVGTQKGSIQEDLSQKQILGAEFITKDTVNELISDLKNKKIDAAILEKPVAESFVMRHKDLINIECHSGAYDALLGSAIAVKKGNPEFLKEINRILAELKKENKIIEFVEDAKILMNK